MIDGAYGPNDNGYMVNGVREAAKHLKLVTMIYSEGHYPHSNAREVPEDHPIVVALRLLAEFDKDKCQYANVEHDPKLFAPYKPTEEAKQRWN